MDFLRPDSSYYEVINGLEDDLLNWFNLIADIGLGKLAYDNGLLWESKVNLAGDVISSVANLISFFSYNFAVYGLILPWMIDSFLISFWDFAICISKSPFDALFLRIP